MEISIVSNEDISGINAPFPNALQLSNGQLFLVNSAGMFFCSQNLEPIKFHEYYNKTINNYENIIDKILISQFEEDGNIICVVEDVFYFFKENSNFITMGKFPREITQSSYLNLLTYKKDEQQSNHFIITFMDEPNKNLYLFHYLINKTEYKIVSNNTYFPFYFDYPIIEINNKYFTCQIMNSDKKGKVLTCCFQTFENDLITVQSFDIENNLTEIEEYYAKTPIDNLNMITSTISEDKKTILVCYTPKNNFGYCLTYNFDSNQISNNRVLIEKCSNNYNLFKVKYFKEKEEYIFICDNTDNQFTVIKFDKNFNLINPNEITSYNFGIPYHFSFHSLSLIYDTSENNYALIIDPKNNTYIECMTKKFIITTNFSENFASELDKPEEFVEEIEIKDLSIKESNKYYVFTENHDIIATSDKDSKIIIDFLNVDNLFIKTKDNKPIDPSLYTFYFHLNNFKGKLTTEINGKEKIIEKISYISNITHLYYYPKFMNVSYTNSLTYSLFLKNKSLASEASQLVVYVCKENCTCDQQQFDCKECLDDYVVYKYRGNCRSNRDLMGLVYDENQKVYLDCFKMCKTCSKVGYSEYDMNCLTCFEEYGDYMDEEKNACYSKYCENLYYKDKDTGMKTCINETSCPEEYPIHNKETNQCEQNKTILTDLPIYDISTSEESDSISIETQTKTDEATESSKSDTKAPSLETDVKKDNILYEQLMDLIDELVGKENIDVINKTYTLLSDSIKNYDISMLKNDVTIIGKNITYQLTTSENQKNTEQISNVSIIDLGECEKIIKRNISYEDDPTPLLILKIDVKKGEKKSTAVEYEVYNPYTRQKIDLSICSNTSISIYAPVSLNNQETSLYNNLKNEGYDLFDVNNSFFIDPCTPYTSSNGTDVSLADRKDYYYNEDIVLCEDTCKYIEVNTKTEKVLCECNVKNEVNIDSDQEFSPQKLIENFYKIDAYSNFDVLYCYKLVFSKKGLKNNICFYILLVLFFFFMTSMIVNLFSAMKKIDEIIFKIFQFKDVNNIFKTERKGTKRKTKNELNINSNKEGFEKYKIDIFNSKKKNKQFLTNDSEIKKGKFSKGKKRKKKKIINESLISSTNQKIINNDNSEIKEQKPNKSEKNINNKNIENNFENNVDKDLNKENNKNNENNINDNNQENKQNNEDEKRKVSNININIINNIINKQNPPLKNNNNVITSTYSENKLKIKDNYEMKLKKRKPRKKIFNNENPFSSIQNSSSAINLKKYSNLRKNKNKISNYLNDYAKDSENTKKLDEKIIMHKKEKDEENIKYIDEELNRMDYENALKNDKRTYWQYYWSLLKKKHMIILTFVSNEDYNVFLLKFSLFILFISLFFSINTLFYKDSTMHQIFVQKGKYNLLYQIPQVLYSTLISFLMNLILKKLSLSQNELISIKEEQDQIKSKEIANKSKNSLRIKLYSFFFVGIIILLFFWYYITAFAAVYTNTQIHLIKDTLISFGISMAYPLIINLFPGIFRMYSLNSEKKDRESFYKFGQILALL